MRSLGVSKGLFSTVENSPFVMRRAMRGMARLYAEPIIWWILRTVFGSQTFRLFLGFDAVYPSAIQQVLVEPLQVQRSEVCQRNAADLRLDVVFQKTLRGFVGRWAQFDFRVVFHPDLQPTAHGVGLGFGQSPRADTRCTDRWRRNRSARRSGWSCAGRRCRASAAPGTRRSGRPRRCC